MTTSPKSAVEIAREVADAIESQITSIGRYGASAEVCAILVDYDKLALARAVLAAEAERAAVEEVVLHVPAIGKSSQVRTWCKMLLPQSNWFDLAPSEREEIRTQCPDCPESLLEGGWYYNPDPGDYERRGGHLIQGLPDSNYTGGRYV